ncbi:hypothetical protein OH76DRAFT_1562375, partial [Lentinus brumalis]
VPLLTLSQISSHGQPASSGEVNRQAVADGRQDAPRLSSLVSRPCISRRLFVVTRYLAHRADRRHLKTQTAHRSSNAGVLHRHRAPPPVCIQTKVDTSSHSRPPAICDTRRSNTTRTCVHASDAGYAATAKTVDCKPVDHDCGTSRVRPCHPTPEPRLLEVASSQQPAASRRRGCTVHATSGGRSPGGRPARSEDPSPTPSPSPSPSRDLRAVSTASSPSVHTSPGTRVPRSTTSCLDDRGPCPASRRPASATANAVRRPSSRQHRPIQRRTGARRCAQRPRAFDRRPLDH